MNAASANVTAAIVDLVPAGLRLAAVQPGALEELMLVGAALITLIGVWLSWAAPRHRMSIEEHAKDGKLTDDEARRKIRRIEWFGPAVVGAGFALAGVVLLLP